MDTKVIVGGVAKRGRPACALTFAVALGERVTRKSAQRVKVTDQLWFVHDPYGNAAAMIKVAVVEIVIPKRKPPHIKVRGFGGALTILVENFNHLFFPHPDVVPY